MKKISLIISLLLAIGELFAQQIPHSSQYMLNQYSINPAVTGITDDIPLAFSYQKLWAGVSESPSVQYLSGHMNIFEKMGAGAKIFNFQTGPIRKTGLEIAYSYHIEFSNENILSFGLSGSLYQYFLNKNKLNPEIADDNVLSGSDKMIVPDATFGTYLYGEKFYVGLAIPQLINKSIDLKTDNILQLKQVRHYYLHGGYNFELSGDLKLEPSLLFKFIEAGLFQVDVNTRMIYRDMLSFGLTFRNSSDLLVLHLGYLFENFQVGYAFDFIFTGLSPSTFGSHEICLIYKIKR